ncbi:hypothetical protein B2J93_4610 [Marssonina coronariae]|uniref:Chromatin modification-related protein EAF6 n=1 Tax=Diplocarpon coronariae TaxID=2795749 RepID=A0A218Z2S7_9HELO|nr:hypothetical protein B2J93_4610 [Marssonina coronariae]
MAEAPKSSAPVPVASDSVRGSPYYDQTRAHLKVLLTKRQVLEERLRKQEEAIYRKESEYLEDTPHGNIITGFEAYTKGSSMMPGQRRRAPVRAEDRIFSGSSVSFGNGLETSTDTAQSTPVATAAPTPISTGFIKGEAGSNAATPTSSTSANRNGAGGKKNKKSLGGNEDSDTDTKDVKKIRTNFGAVGRKVTA